MFHSLFNVSVFEMTRHNLLTFGMTLQRLKFPTNVSVHINSTWFCYTVNPYRIKLILA